MKIAIIIPTYNRPALLIRAIESVMGQTYQNWLLVICNDCSTVDYSCVEPLLSDSRIYMTQTEKNGGCNLARNTAIDRAIELGADYLLTSMDDEDTLDPRCLEVAVENISKHPEFSWFLSNTFGDTKKSSQDIQEDRGFDWIDDYMYGKKLRGDKTHVISSAVLGPIRFDGRYRSSNMWPFYLPLCAKTKIWGYVYPSQSKEYLPGGITKSSSRVPKNWLELYSRFAKHARVVSIRPTKFSAYKYLVLELVKSLPRALHLIIYPPPQKKR